MRGEPLRKKGASVPLLISGGRRTSGEWAMEREARRNGDPCDSIVKGEVAADDPLKGRRK